jgi:hypothetical protein
MFELFNKMMQSYIIREDLSAKEKQSLLEILRNNPIELENYVLSEIENKHLSPITH